MPPLRKITPQVLDQHDDIDDHPREYVESMEAGDRKEVVGKVFCRRPPIRIIKRILPPPGAFTMQMPPLPRLAAKKGYTAKDRPDHIDSHLLLIIVMTGSHRQYHGHG